MFCGFLIYLFDAEYKVSSLRRVCADGSFTYALFALLRGPLVSHRFAALGPDSGNAAIRSLSRLLERRRSEALYSAARDERTKVNH